MRGYGVDVIVTIDQDFTLGIPRARKEKCDSRLLFCPQCNRVYENLCKSSKTRKPEYFTALSGFRLDRVVCDQCRENNE